MIISHTTTSSFLLLLGLTISYLPLVCSRVLVRPSVNTLIPYNTDSTTDQDATRLQDRSDEKSVSGNAFSSSDQMYDDIRSFITTKRLYSRAGKQPAAATDDELATFAAKGCSMLYMLAADADDALTRMKTNANLAGLTSSQSKWTNAGALKQYGWREKKDPVNWGYMGINDVMKDLEVPQTQDNKNYQMLQDTAVEVDGKKYVASEGVYDQAINVAAGLIIPYYVYSPRNEAETHNIKGDLVPLAQYSDVLFLEYAKLCGRANEQISTFQHMMVLNIENPNTWSIALKALMNKNGGKKDMPLWPGTEFSLNEAEGKALLGTQIGAPLAWMLIQHKEAFGIRTVVKVRIFRNKGMTNRDTDQPYPSLLFYVGDAPKDNHCEPEDSCCCPKF